MEFSKIPRISRVLIFGILISSFLFAIGCGPKKASQEQIQLLSERKATLSALQQEVSALKKEKGQVENQLAERKKKLEDAKSEKAKVIERLEMIEKGEYMDKSEEEKTETE